MAILGGFPILCCVQRTRQADGKPPALGLFISWYGGICLDDPMGTSRAPAGVMGLSAEVFPNHNAQSLLINILCSRVLEQSQYSGLRDFFRLPWEEVIKETSPHFDASGIMKIIFCGRLTVEK